MARFVVKMNMENVPDNCEKCDMVTWCSDCEGYEDKCILNPSQEISHDGIPNWCPILCQLPEGHGRMGDLDALKKYVEKKDNDRCGSVYTAYHFYDFIAEQPTIVPAEK